MTKSRSSTLTALRLSLGLLVFKGPGTHLQFARAEVRLPKVFGSHMVLQQEKPLVFWGWAEPGESVTVRISAEPVQVRCNERGE